jgi:hypothetical protein
LKQPDSPTPQFPVLLGGASLGEQDGLVSLAQQFQAAANSLKELDRMLAHGFSHGIDPLQSVSAGHDFWLKKQISVFQRRNEIFAAVAVLLNVLMLNLGKGLLDVHGTEPEFPHPLKKLLSRLLEIDIVLPERVVGIISKAWQVTIHETPSDFGKSLGTARSLPILSAYSVD